MSEEEIIDKVMMIDQWKVSGDIYTQNELNAIGELLDLYNKEKEKNRQSKMRIVQLENEITARIEDVNKYFISKDKIREKIEEYKKQQKEEPDAYLCIKVLQSLLEKE